MRAEAVSWDDWSVSNPPPIADDEKWHVEVEPNDVKVVTLEQLDDLFRLSIVDSETKVWQAGMSDWQPLRVIAGLDESPTPPAPPARRAPPKPPSRVPSPSVRPAPPAPRQLSASVRPAAPLSRTMPMPHVVPPVAQPAPLARTVVPAPGTHRPPASFYPEPISAYPPVAYAAPVTRAPTAQVMNSVRPLVVSRAPAMPQRGGGGFGRFLVGVALLGGVGITAYRNDYLREGAHAAHQDALYARLETALGGPAFGTLRALEETATTLPAAALGANINAGVRMAADSPAAAMPSAPAPAQPEKQAPTSGTTSTPPVVSLESLTPEKKGLAAAAPVAPAPVRAAISSPQPRPAPAPPAPAKAPPARAAASPRPVVEKPVVEKPAPVPQKPASEMTDRERLNAAIGQSMMQADAPKPKGKKAKSKGNEYDPLNPNL
jgi:hypothetical protein